MPAASWPPGLAFWQALTRLGEAQILLPLMLAVAGWLAWRQGARRLALAVSGRPQPYQRWMMHRDHRRAPPAAAPAASVQAR